MTGDKDSQVENLCVEVLRMANERGGENGIRFLWPFKQHENDGKFICQRERIRRCVEAIAKYFRCFVKLQRFGIRHSQVEILLRRALVAMGWLIKQGNGSSVVLVVEQIAGEPVERGGRAWIDGQRGSPFPLRIGVLARSIQVRAKHAMGTRICRVEACCLPQRGE